MQDPLISIVVIGRNEGRHLARLFASLDPLRRAWPCEAIFVDSASTDESVDIAAVRFDETLVLEDSACLNASAGRYAGVQVARGRWALFLDGDMEFEAACLPELAAVIASGREDVGAIGKYLHRYDDGSTKQWLPPLSRDGFVSHFGGAVLLPLAALRTENWDPRLYSNEEIELYTRLRERGVRVQRLNAPFISHTTARLTIWEKLRGNFWPNGSFLGKKFFGIGQVLLARASGGRLASLVRWFPEPFVLWGTIALAIAATFFGHPWISFPLLAAGTTFVIRRRSVSLVIGYLAFLPQAIFGMRQFHPNWRPRVVKRIVRDASSRTLGARPNAI